MSESISSGVWSLYSGARKRMRCMWGRPCFWNSIVHALATVRPVTPCFSKSLSRWATLAWKTWTTKSGRSEALCPGSSSQVISGQLGFAVTVMKRSAPWKWWLIAVLYTPTVCPTESVRLSLDPAISDGPSRQSIRSPSESVGHDWILLLVWAKSSESLFKPPRSKKWMDWPEFCVHWTSAGLSLDFWWTEAETSHIC